MTPSDPSTWTLPRLRVDKDGAWYHEDEEVTHPGIVSSLRAALERDAEGYCIRIGAVRVPVVVEDDAFIGSRSMIVEGARVRTGSVVGSGTILNRSSHVIDVQTGEELPPGEVPAWSVAVGGTRPRKFPGGEFGMPCVLVLKRLPEGGAHDKLALNEILRDHGVSG